MCIHSYQGRGGQEKVLDFLKLELQTLVSHLGDGDCTWALWKSSQCALNTLQPHFSVLCTCSASRKTS